MYIYTHIHIYTYNVTNVIHYMYIMHVTHIEYISLLQEGFFFYLFLAALGLCCCARAFSSCGERGLLFVVVSGLLIAVAFLVAEHEL